jgi:hypothetical protein
VRTPSSTTTLPARFLLLGDSHAGPIGRAAKAAHIPFQGGPIGAGREFTYAFFKPDGADIVFHSADAQAHYRAALSAMDVGCLGDLSVPLVATFGFCAHFVATKENWRLYQRPDGSYPPAFLTSALFDGIVDAVVRDALAFYRHTTDLGLRVLAVMPPQRVPGQSDPAVFKAAQERIRQAIANIGVEIVDLRDRTTTPDGLQRSELCESDDEIHGNLAFGRVILADLLYRGL